MARNKAGADGLPTTELGARARAAVEDLASRPEIEAFEELLAISQVVGVCMGESARLLAANSSWSQVADISGTTKQAAWSRWRG